MDYKNKLITPEQAASVVKSGDWVDYSFCLSRPYAFDKALALRKDELRDVKVRGAIVLDPLQIIECDPGQEHFSYFSWHMSAYERRMSDAGRCCHIPMMYESMPYYYRKSLDVDVACISVAPMDKEGWFSFSLTSSANKAILSKAKTVIVEINENLPPVGGYENAVHIDEVDFVIESGNPPIPELPAAVPSEMDRKIASTIISRIHDEAVLQLGIGGLPNAVGAMVAESDLRNLGGHTEMLVDAYRVMMGSGRLNNERKRLHRGKTLFTFAAGTTALYDWIRHHTDSLSAMAVDYVNDPSVIAQNDDLVSINGCVDVDLTGQFNSESSGFRQISGAGGQFDFVLGSYHSPKGQSFICCQSTVLDKKTGIRKSRIVPSLAQGSIVSTPRPAAQYLVTEYGIADLAGQSLWDRAERIIAVAHPDFRDQLIREAETHNLWRRSNKIGR